MRGRWEVGRPSRGRDEAEGVERSRRRATLSSLLDRQTLFREPLHELYAGERTLGGFERCEPQPLYTASTFPGSKEPGQPDGTARVYEGRRRVSTAGVSQFWLCRKFSCGGAAR